MSQETAEGAVLSAALDGDQQTVEDRIMGMYPLERATLAAACDRVADECRRLANAPMVDLGQGES